MYWWMGREREKNKKFNLWFEFKKISGLKFLLFRRHFEHWTNSSGLLFWFEFCGLSQTQQLLVVWTCSSSEESVELSESWKFLKKIPVNVSDEYRNAYRIGWISVIITVRWTITVVMATWSFHIILNLFVQIDGISQCRIDWITTAKMRETI